MELQVLAKHFIPFFLPDCIFLGLLFDFFTIFTLSFQLWEVGKWQNCLSACLGRESGCLAFEWDGAPDSESVSYEAGTRASSQRSQMGCFHLLSRPISVDFII